MADRQVDPGGSSISTAGAAFERVHGDNVLAGTYVSGGTLNINFRGGNGEDTHAGPSSVRRLISSDQQPESSSQPFALIPFLPDRDFIERPDIASWLSDKCQPGNRAALVGLGGVG